MTTRNTCQGYNESARCSALITLNTSTLFAMEIQTFKYTKSQQNGFWTHSLNQKFNFPLLYLKFLEYILPIKLSTKASTAAPPLNTISTTLNTVVKAIWYVWMIWSRIYPSVVGFGTKHARCWCVIFYVHD